MKKLLTLTILSTLIALLATPFASAHVVVSPSSIATGTWQTFSISVPNEKDIPTTKITLDIPADVAHVTPTMQSGFTIATTKDQSDVIKTISWTGNIPVGQRAELSFSAQAPAKATELHWNAYQYYTDGSVVKWNEDPTAKDDGHSGTPYSVTNVTDTTEAPSTTGTSMASNLAIGFSIAALVLSIGALFINRRK